MTTTDIMHRLCHSFRMFKPGDHQLWFINASPRYMDVMRVAKGLVGPWFEVVR